MFANFQEKKNESGTSSVPEQKSVMVTVDGKPKHPGGKKPPKVVPTSNMVCNLKTIKWITKRNKKDQCHLSTSFNVSITFL